MIEINLIPDVKREYLKARSLRNMVITMSILVSAGVVALAIVLGLILSGQLVAEAVQSNKIKEDGAKLVAIEDIDKTVTIQQQLSKIDEQQKNKVYNSRLFDMVAAINPLAPNDIKIALLKLNPETQTITVEGSAGNGYLALEVFKKTIMNTSIQIGKSEKTGDSESESFDIKNIALASNIVTGDTSFGENTEGQRVLRFSFTFTYADELFAVSKTPVSIITPAGKTDVTDSKLGIPESLFSPRASDTSKKEGDR